VAPAPDWLTQQDTVLITYGDQFQADGQPHLQTLQNFLETYLDQSVSVVHLLPFYPYSSDDGFSVVDYRRIDAALGSWQDIHRLGQRYRLMFDAVINHISRHSKWFQGFLQGEKPYNDYFIRVDPQDDISQVFRPRALPLLTPFDTAEGRIYVWTTFSEDQIDLNYSNPRVLLEILALLLYYVEQGADLIRLDAIAYLWKTPGTSCLHLPQTHAVIKFLRAALDMAAPHVLLITETNVPHQENISYFGSRLPGSTRTDEAQLVYNFSLAPLLLHTFHSGNARVLSEWVETLDAPGLFFNFTASHDGIGVQPARGLLTDNQIRDLANRTLLHGGELSYKTEADGSRSIYELNITWYDALNSPIRPDPTRDTNRFIASQVIMLSLAGLPGIYVHTLFGSHNCLECRQETGRARSINRQKFRWEDIRTDIQKPTSHRGAIFNIYRRLLDIRRQQAAFHPRAAQKVLHIQDGVFALIRTRQQASSPLVCLVNVSDQPEHAHLPFAGAGLPAAPQWVDLIQEKHHIAEPGFLDVVLAPYQSVWLTPLPEA